MEITSWPGCCGAYILKDFGGTQVTSGSEELVDLYDIRLDLQHYIAGYGKVSFIAAALNKDQIGHYGETFEECGFMPLAGGHNYKHNSEIVMYVYQNKGD